MLSGYSPRTIERWPIHQRGSSSNGRPRRNSCPRRQPSNYFLVRGPSTRHYAASPFLRSFPASLSRFSLSPLYPLSRRHYASLTSEQVPRSIRGEKAAGESAVTRARNKNPPRLYRLCLSNKSERSSSLRLGKRATGTDGIRAWSDRSRLPLKLVEREGYARRRIRAGTTGQ